jgi:predicted Zn-dependent peptidase
VSRVVRATAVAALALLAADAAAAPFEVESLEVPGGARLLLARRSGRRATLVVQFARGSVDDGNRSGATRLAQHALLAANARLDYARLVLAVHASAGSLALQTDPLASAIVLEADRRDFDAIAPKLLAALLSPRLDRERFHTAIARALHDAREPGRSGGLLELVAATASSDTRFANEPCGDRDQIELFQADEVERLFADSLSPANATVVVAGAFDRDGIVREVRRHVRGTRTPLSPPSYSLPVRSRGTAANELHVLAWPLRLESPKDSAVARVLAVLAERVLWERFRDAGASYSFDVGAFRSPGIDLFVAAVPVLNASGADLSRYVEGAIEELRAGSFDDAALERARAVALGDMAGSDESAAAVAAELAAGGASWHGREVDLAMRELDRAAFLERAGAWLDRERSIALHFAPPKPKVKPKEKRR